MRNSGPFWDPFGLVCLEFGLLGMADFERADSAAGLVRPAPSLEEQTLLLEASERSTSCR